MAHDHAEHHGEHHDADAEYLPVDGSSYEHTDADVRTTIRFGMWLAIITVATHVALGGAFAGLIAWSNETGEPRYPLAAGRPAPKPPEPTLQQYPDRDMTVFKTRDEGELHGYGYVDRETGRVHIPIDEAIRQTLERGLPSRPETDAAAAGTPGMLASDASGGRVLERRRQ